jgi:hypothetical protein
MKILFGIVFLIVHGNAKEIPAFEDNEFDFDLKAEKGLDDPKLPTIVFDEAAPQNTMVQYDNFMNELMKGSEEVITNYGSTLNQTRDHITTGMGGALTPYNDWVKLNSKKYPELHTYPKLQEFTSLISSFQDTSHQSVKAFTTSYLRNVEEVSKQLREGFRQKGNEVLSDIMEAPEVNPLAKKCKAKHVKKFTALGNTAFRQLDSCINSEIRAQRRLQATTDVSLRNMKNYVRGVVDKLNICYVKDYYDRPLDCVDREVSFFLSHLVLMSSCSNFGEMFSLFGDSSVFP